MLLSVLKEWRAMPAGGPSLPWLLLGLSVLALGGQMSRAQTVAPRDQKVGTPAAPVVISLQEALKRAQANEPNFAASLANARIAGLDKSIARAGLLPAVTYHNQALYTQPGGQGQGIGANTFKFIGNNAVHEYASQAMVNEDIGLGQIAAVRRADAAAAVASAELEIARRGLVAAVVGIYYGLSSADRKRGIAEQAADEAAAFVKLTSQREQAREAAHADTIKAQLQQQQRERELEDAKLNADKARLELGVLLFADPRTPYTINISAAPAALTSREEVNQLAAKNNAELRSALATLNMSSADVLAARGAYLPGLAINYTYGIDAPQFAVNGPDRVNNVGYSASVTVDLPVWDWLATEHKVKQSVIARNAAKTALSATQRRVIAQLDEAYAEAQTARTQLASLDTSVATAAESLRLTKLRYTGGEATVLEVVDAQAAYVSAQNAREDGRVRYQTALAQLQTLTGTM